LKITKPHDRQYKTYHRIELAKRLLQETECTVSDIALSLLGYNAVNAFCMNFKKHVGQTPQEFREREKTTTLKKMRNKMNAI